MGRQNKTLKWRNLIDQLQYRKPSHVFLLKFSDFFTFLPDMTLIFSFLFFPWKQYLENAKSQRLAVIFETQFSIFLFFSDISFSKYSDRFLKHLKNLSRIFGKTGFQILQLIVEILTFQGIVFTEKRKVHKIVIYDFTENMKLQCT